MSRLGHPMKILTVFAILSSVSACNVVDKIASNDHNESKDTAVSEGSIIDAKKQVPIELSTIRTPGKGGPSISDFAQRDPNILASEIAILEAYESIQIEESELGLQTDMSLQGGSKSLRDGDNGVFASFSASQKMYDNGVTKNNIYAAEKRLEIAYATHSKTVNTALNEALGVYTRYGVAAEVMNLAYLKLSKAEDVYESLAKLSAAGQIDSATLAQAKQSINRLKLTNSEAKMNFTKVASELEELFNVKAENVQINIDESALNDITGQVTTNNNTEVKIARLELELAEIELNTLKSSQWGNVAFNAQADVPASVNGDKPDLLVGLMYSKILGDGGRLGAQIKGGELKIDRLRQSLRAQQQNAEVTLSTSNKQVLQIETSMVLRDDMIENARLNVEQLENQLIIGMSSFSSVLDAHVALFNLEKEQIIDAGELIAAKVNIVQKHGKLNELVGLTLPLLSYEPLKN